MYVTSTDWSHFPFFQAIKSKGKKQKSGQDRGSYNRTITTVNCVSQSVLALEKVLDRIETQQKRSG